MSNLLEEVRALRTSAGAAGTGGTGVVAVGLADHAHEWVRLPGTVGLFVCADERCLWCAVCPGCLRSLDVALRVQAGVPGLLLSWCLAHDGSMREGAR